MENKSRLAWKAQVANIKQRERTIALVLVLVALVLCWQCSIHFGADGKRFERLSAETAAMQAVQRAAETYAARHSGAYPFRLDKSFVTEVETQNTGGYNTSPKSSAASCYWLSILPVSSEAESLTRAQSTGASNGVFYCPLMKSGHPIGYFVLGKDERGDLLSAADGRPLVLRN